MLKIYKTSSQRVVTLVNTPANRQAKGLILQSKRQTVLSQAEAAMAKSDTLSSVVDWQALEPGGLPMRESTPRQEHFRIST